MPQMTLSDHQTSAVKAIDSWYKSAPHNKPAFVLNGFAGTGKSSIARLFPELITGGGEESVLYAALTGKATLQLRKKGCLNATTLHKLLYSPLEKDRKALLALTKALGEELKLNPLGDSPQAHALKREIHAERKRVATPGWQLKPTELSPAVKLLVIDESSMVDQKIYNDLLALNKKIIFLGDPFQLPPVFGISPVMSQQPDHVLTEVHRQAWDNPVLRAATALRNGAYPSQDPGQEQFQMLKTKDATYETYAAADQVLCGRNVTRRRLNAKLRARLAADGKLIGTGLPACAGDKVVFLRNDHDEKIFNGTLATLTSVTDGEDPELPAGLLVDATDDEQLILGYEVWGGVLSGHDISEAPRRAQVIDLGYALTVHKAQGSEWPHIVVHNEPIGHGQDARRWLYTAISRAQEKCVVVTRES